MNDLSTLVSARLCHDLVSPLGAIGNGLELIEMSGSGRNGPELQLVTDSLANAIGKLKFLRVAFGPADAGARQSFEEADGITAAAFPGRYSVVWLARGGSMPRPLAKALYLAILCLEKSLPLGGEVHVDGDDACITLRVEGRRTAPPTELWDHVLQGTGIGPVGSDSVQFKLLRDCLESLGGEIAARFSDSGASLELKVPAAAPA
jgi:histidine phosphotransferase ChpT